MRLGILTVAHEARRVEFSYLRDTLALTAGNLSQHLGVLETAGLIAMEKGYAGKRARTVLRALLAKSGAWSSRLPSTSHGFSGGGRSLPGAC
jgi:DNA-binding MarR family transcriptional regulator